MATRTIRPRLIPKRSSQRRGATRGTSIITRRRTIENEQNYINTLRVNSNSFINSISNLNNIESETNNFLSRNIGNISPSYQQQFRQFVLVAKNNLITKTNQIKSAVDKKLAFSFREEATAIRNLNRTKSSSGRANFISAIANIRGGREATQEVINRLNNGERLELAAISKFIKDSANFAGEKKFSTELSRQQNITLKTKSSAINKFVNNLVEKGQLVTANVIKDKFKLSTSEAKNIETLLRSNINSTTSSQNKVINEVKLVIDKGARYSLNDLKNSGLTQPQINSIVTYQTTKQNDLIKAMTSGNFKTLTVGQLVKEFIDPKTKTFNLLNNKLQSKVYSYNTKQDAVNIFNYLKQAPSIKEVNDLGSNINLLSKDLVKVLPSITLKEFGLNIKQLEKNKLSSRDILNIAKLRAISNSKLKELIAKSDDKIIAYLDSLNKYYSVEKATSDKTFELIFNKLTRLQTTAMKKLNINLKEQRNTRFTFNGLQKLNKFTDYAKYTLLLKNLADKKSKRGYITVSEYNEYKSMVVDFLGVKTLSKQSIEKAKKNFGSSKYVGLVLTIKDIQKFLKGSGIQAVKISIETVKFLANLLGRATKSVSKTTYNSLVELGYESAEYLTSKFKKLPKSDKNTLFSQTKDRVSKIKKAGLTVSNATKWIIDHPEEVTLATTILLVAGVKGLRKKLITDPKGFIAQIVSFFITDVFIKTGVTGLKLIKATFSPFVIRYTKILETASIRGSATALKQLEGKKINLFHATTSNMDDLFKSTSITKAESKLLIKQMLRNPKVFMGANLKIKSLKSIITTLNKRVIVDFMKLNKGKAFLSGSGSLKLQLKTFRKINDLDIIAKNPKLFATQLKDFLNNKTFLGKITKVQRYKIYTTGRSRIIFDSGVTGRLKYSKSRGIADVVDLKTWSDDFGRALSKKDLVNIGGIDVLKAQTQLATKTKLLGDPLFSRRYEKELKDLKLILSKINKNIGQKKYGLVKKLLDKEKGMLKIKGIESGSGLDRKFSWVRKYFPQLQLNFGHHPKQEKLIFTKLKKIGFTNKQIADNIRLYAPADMYFSPNSVYSHYLFSRGKLGKQAGVIFIKNVKISVYPKSIQTLIKKNVAGLLNIKEQTKLRGLMRLHRLKNPNKFFIGEKAIADRFGEFEILAPEYTKLFSTKFLLNKQIYYPALQKFIKVQEAVLKKKSTLSVLKSLVNSVKTKFKKGYSISQMKKDVLKWAKLNIKNLKPSKAQLKALQVQQKLIDDEIKAIKNSKLAFKTKSRIIKNLRATRRFITPTRRRTSIAARVTRVLKISRKARRVIPRARKVIARRPITRVIVRPRKPVVRKPVKRTITRPRKRVVRRTPIRPRVRPRLRTTPRPARTPVRPRVRPPTKPTKIPPKKIILPKIKLSFKRKPPKDNVYLVNAKVKMKGKVRLIRLKTTLNRGLKYMINLVDNTTTRSFDLILIGLSKTKDIKPPSLQKFRRKLSKNPLVLRVVEKSRYSIDTVGEKRGLKIGKLIKRRKSKSKRNKTKSKRRKSNKK